MQSVEFFNELTFGDALVAKIGDPVLHTSPLPPTLHGACRLPAVATTVHWAVDPQQTVLHLLFLADGGSSEASWEKPFVARKWLLSFGSEVLSCGIAVAGGDEAGVDTVIRVVWISAALTVEVLSFSIQRRVDGSDGIIVEPVGQARSTGVLVRCKDSFRGTPVGALQVAVIQQVSQADTLAALAFTDGSSLWTVQVRSTGAAHEVCLMDGRTAPGNHSNTTQGVTGWLQRWWQSNAPDASSSSPVSSQGRRTILGICSVPGKEGIIIVNGNGQTALLTSYTQPMQPVELFRFADIVPVSSVMLRAFVHEEEPNTNAAWTLDVVVAGYVASDEASPASHETFWLHRCALNTANAGHDTLPTVLGHVSLFTTTAPTTVALLQSVAVTRDSLLIAWRGRTQHGLPVSLAALAGHSTSTDGNLSTTIHRVNFETDHDGTPYADTHDVFTTSGDSLHALAACPGTSQVWIASSFQDQKIQAALLFPTLSNINHLGDWLHAPISHQASTVTPPTAIPFASVAYCPVTSNTPPVIALDQIAVAEGVHVITSHAEGLQTWVNLIADAVNNISMITTLGGYHELAAAAKIFAHSGVRPVTGATMRAVVQSALSASTTILPIRILQLTPQVARSRWFVHQAVGVELQQRIALVITSYIAWVAHEGHCDEEHSAVQRDVRSALELLCAALNAAHASGSRLPSIALYGNDIILSVLDRLLNGSGEAQPVHAADVALQFWSLGGVEGWYSSAAWMQALRRQHTLLQHGLVLQLLEASRTTSSAEATSISLNVAADLNTLPFDDASRILDMFAESLSIPLADLDAYAFLDANRRCIGSVYRMVLLRRLLPRGSIHHSLLSATIAANSFLPDVVAMKLLAAEQLGVNATFTIALSALIADVYVLLARSAIGDGDLSNSVRWIGMALSLSRESVIEAAQRLVSIAADMIFAEGWHHELVHLGVGDGDTLILLGGALVQSLQRLTQNMRTSTLPHRAENERQLLDATVATYRFLVHRHACGQASRLAFDVALAIRQSTAHPELSTLVCVEQLMGLALSAAESISEAAGKMSAVNDQSVVARGSISGKPFLCRDDIPMLERKFLEATYELELMEHDHHVDGKEYGEELASEAASTYASRLLRSLLAARLWEEARTYAEMVIPDLLNFALQCQAVDLLEDPQHQLVCGLREDQNTLALSSSAFASIVDQWSSFVKECVAHATPSTNYEGLTAPLMVVLSRRHELVPNVLKDALRALRPSLLVHLLLTTRVTPQGCDVPEVPTAIAREIFALVTDVLTEDNPAPSMQLTAGVIDRSVVLAREVCARPITVSDATDAQDEAEAFKKFINMKLELKVKKV